MASLPYLRQTIRPFTTSMSVTSFSAAAFSTSSIQRGLKESDKDRENLHIEYDQHKSENLKNAKAGKGHWREQLASESEASVKADRGETGEDIKEPTKGKVGKGQEQRK